MASVNSKNCKNLTRCGHVPGKNKQLNKQTNNQVPGTNNNSPGSNTASSKHRPVEKSPHLENQRKCQKVFSQMWRIQLAPEFSEHLIHFCLTLLFTTTQKREPPLQVTYARNLVKCKVEILKPYFVLIVLEYHYPLAAFCMLIL